MSGRLPGVMFALLERHSHWQTSVSLQLSHKRTPALPLSLSLSLSLLSSHPTNAPTMCSLPLCPQPMFYCIHSAAPLSVQYHVLCLSTMVEIFIFSSSHLCPSFAPSFLLVIYYHRSHPSFFSRLSLYCPGSPHP